MFYWSPGMTLDYLEKTAIQQAYKFYQGNKTLTSRALGCSVNTLKDKLERYAQEEENAKQQAAEASRRDDEFGRRQRGIPAGADFPNGPHYQRQMSPTPRAEVPANRAVSNSGVPVESNAEAGAKQSMPMQERKEVQKVLPKSTAKNGKK